MSPGAIIDFIRNITILANVTTVTIVATVTIITTVTTWLYLVSTITGCPLFQVIGLISLIFVDRLDSLNVLSAKLCNFRPHYTNIGHPAGPTSDFLAGRPVGQGGDTVAEGRQRLVDGRALLQSGPSRSRVACSLAEAGNTEG